jgi:peptidoglycan/LPS O-acetylase OafA/YrhL
MLNSVLTATGAGICVLWGAAHVAPTRAVVAGFGDLSTDNRRILTMEWIAEGLALIFLGTLVLLVTFLGDGGGTARLVVRAVAAMLVVMAALSLATGARTSILPMRLCPWVKLTCAALIVAGT